MSPADDAAALIKAGDPGAALKALQDAVRGNPENGRLRVFLFQLLCVEGQWNRALNQLEVCAEMDDGALGMREMYRGAVSCEALRSEVFSGKRAPMLFGEPEPWLAMLIESLLQSGRGDSAASASLRERALEEAPASRGILDGKAFDWIADADSRLGPVLEAVINGRYYWIPFNRISRMQIEAPEDLRDVVWAVANIQFSNGGEMPALIPTRYPGSESSEDGLTRLARSTSWIEIGTDAFAGLGQRLLATDSGDFPLLECRELEVTSDGAG